MKTSEEMEPAARLKAVVDHASAVVINPTVKATQYVRSGREMLRSAINYHEDGNPENAYVLYMRFLTIFLDKLRHHPGFKELAPSEKKVMNSYCNEILPKAEALKAELLQKYEKEYEDHKKQLEEIMRRAERAREEEALRQQKQNTKANSGHGHTGGQGIIAAGNLPMSNKWQNNWPYEDPPSALPSHFLPDPKSLAMGGSSRPLAEVSYSNIFDKDGKPHTPGFDRNTKPGRFLSPMSTGLRQVIVPDDLIPAFIKLAESNTRKNVETCGLLTGKILNGKLVITDLIIPKQQGTSDSCTTHNEEEYTMIQDQFDLITFGWIHTHPSQTAFLSSIDMHTHYWYQSMMPEAIAIVCAPSKNEVGTFMLTPNEGMDIIGSCPQTNFHPHPQTGKPLFIEASHHAYDSTLKVKVRDIR